ncbi:hypothetical protein P691DRAFT_783042, partial [Macrolepiota fuliginosa MF-IS2]
MSTGGDSEGKSTVAQQKKEDSIRQSRELHKRTQEVTGVRGVWEDVGKQWSPRSVMKRSEQRVLESQMSIGTLISLELLEQSRELKGQCVWAGAFSEWTSLELFGVPYRQDIGLGIAGLHWLLCPKIVWLTMVMLMWGEEKNQKKSQWQVVPKKQISLGEFMGSKCGCGTSAVASANSAIHVL